MFRAAASGAIDFKEARFSDRKWWQRISWILKEIEAEESLRLVELRSIQHASALNYMAGKKAFSHHWDQLNVLASQWSNIMFPWIEAQSQVTTDSMIKQWKRAMRKYATKDKLRAFTEELQQKSGYRPGPKNSNNVCDWNTPEDN